MIQNIPEPKEFYYSSLNYLNISWEMAFKVYMAICEHGKDEEEYREEQKYYLNTCLVLIHLSIEAFLKYKIACVNPLLLVQLKGEKTDADFSELKTVEAKDLLALHDSVIDENLGSKFSTIFDEIRKKRNKVMHSVSGNLLKENEIINQILDIVHLFFRKPWVHFRNEFISSASGFDAYIENHDKLDEFNSCYLYLTNVKYFKFYSGGLWKDVTLLCENCHLYLEGQKIVISAIRVSPQISKCLICEETAKLKRKKCTNCNTKSISNESGECLHYDCAML